MFDLSQNLKDFCIDFQRNFQDFNLEYFEHKKQTKNADIMGTIWRNKNPTIIACSFLIFCLQIPAIL